jgi:hypothetical protein
MTARTFDVVGAVIAFESGDLDNAETLDLFAHLIATGAAWTLQGSYGRQAAALIEGGLITPTGEITDLAKTALEA